MRIAIVSDIHGNRTALDAVIRDLRDSSPDLVFQGGDVADGGASPADVVDQIAALGWPGVLGNADEIYTRPASLEGFASISTAPAKLWKAIRERAATTRALLGEQRIAWMSNLPHKQVLESMALVHASPQSVWSSPAGNASDFELETEYSQLDAKLVVFGHIHQPFVRSVGQGLVVANAGSVGLPYDRDPRASYLLVDNGVPTIRRVEYSVEAELAALSSCGLPYSDWIAAMLRTAAPQLPA